MSEAMSTMEHEIPKQQKTRVIAERALAAVLALGAAWLNVGTIWLAAVRLMPLPPWTW
jgi:hypothetical protein